MKVALHAPGPVGHGVVRHAATLARLLRSRGVLVVDSGADIVHVQFTDTLWGPDIAAAAAAFVAWAAGVTCPLVVTLHDVPEWHTSTARDVRRRAGFVRVVAAADAVVVSAEHEAAKIAGSSGRLAEVIELPVEPVPAGPPPDWAGRPTLGVLGFVYPGKGHAEVIAAAAHQAERPLVVAAGTVSHGHDELWPALEAQAADAGVDLVLTGPLDDAGMGAAARAVTVPVVPGSAVSASGTLATWWGCGRRPLAAAGPYSWEQARRYPDDITLYAAGDIDAMVATALARPHRTHLGAAPVRPDVAAAHVALYARVIADATPC